MKFFLPMYIHSILIFHQICEKISTNCKHQTVKSSPLHFILYKCTIWLLSLEIVVKTCAMNKPHGIWPRKGLTSGLRSSVILESIYLEVFIIILLEYAHKLQERNEWCLTNQMRWFYSSISLERVEQWTEWSLKMGLSRWLENFQEIKHLK